MSRAWRMKWVGKGFGGGEVCYIPSSESPDGFLHGGSGGGRILQAS